MAISERVIYLHSQTDIYTASAFYFKNKFVIKDMFICFQKEPHNSCYLCSTFCAAFSAMATDSTDTELTIIGEYTHGACTPVVTGGGIVDYGKHHNSALNPTGKSNKLVQLGRKNSTLNITCTAPTLIAVTSKDNRQSTIVALNDTSYIEKAYDTLVDMKGTKNAFGLGSAPNGQKLALHPLVLTGLMVGFTRRTIQVKFLST